MWDFTRGWFDNCQFPREQFLEKDNMIAEPIQGSVPSVVVVSPVRGPKRFPRDIESMDDVPESKPDTHLYEHQIRSMHRMCKFESIICPEQLSLTSSRSLYVELCRLL